MIKFSMKKIKYTLSHQIEGGYTKEGVRISAKNA